MSVRTYKPTAAEKQTRAQMKQFRLPLESKDKDSIATTYFYKLEGPSGTRFIYEIEYEPNDTEPETSDDE